MTLSRMIWNGALVHQVVSEAAEEAAELAAERVLSEANDHVPFETGELQASGVVTSNDNEAFVSYDTPYAVRLHEHPEFHFQGQGEGKWLEKAVQRRASVALADFALPLIMAFRRYP